MENEPVTIVDREVLKVLSNDTRMDILKLLSDGKRNPSFVARKLGKSDATIVEHLQTLESAGLVKKTVAPGRKWVFYSLTERGIGIVSSKSRHLVIILATSLILLMASFGGFGYLYTQTMLGGQFMTQKGLEGRPETEVGESPSFDVPLDNVPIDDAMVIVTREQFLLYLSTALLAVSLTGIGVYFYKKYKFKGRTKLEGMIL